MYVSKKGARESKVDKLEYRYTELEADRKLLFFPFRNGEKPIRRRSHY